MVKEAVALYNNQRMHWSLDLKKSQEVHLQYNQHENKNYKRVKVTTLAP
jgi:putative transposase